MADLHESITPLLPPNCIITVSSYGGYCPVQAAGTISIGDRETCWYFRARGGWSVTFGPRDEGHGDYVDAQDCELYVSGDGGDSGYSGWWEDDDVAPRLIMAFQLWCDGRTGSVEVPRA
jgi:hypothetical protein